jgi:salicylate hydroxylase
MYYAEAVIGADGIRSAVRAYTVGDGEPVLCGDVAYRGAAPIDNVPAAAGTDNVVWWIGPRMHLIQYPIRGGQMFNQVAVFASDAYQPGRRDDEWGTPGELDLRFRGKAGPVTTGVGLVDRSRRWSLSDRDPVPNWTRGRVSLVGDAAHPMLQYLAQGACQALEDAACLAENAAATPDDPQAAFARYQKSRLPRTGRVQQWARWVGQIVHADDPFARMRDALLTDFDNFALVDWLYAEPADEPLASDEGTLL